jgi:hypothetical protein
LNDVLAEVLALARAGAAESARERFHAAGLDMADDNSAALSLKGRLLKDAASTASGIERAALLGRAADAYVAAARLAPATYPLINAATLSLLGGTPVRAAQLATETLALLDSGAHEPETRYWLGATRAEALLLLGRETEARVALRAAVAGTPDAWEDHAVTLRQFRLILAEQHRADDWLDAFRPPPAIHFAGPIGIDASDARLEASIEAAAAAIRPGTATGALAAGFDIVAAEILHRHGAQLHLILPGAVADFVDASVRPYGADWLARFERLMSDAAIVETIDEQSGLSAGAIVLAEEMALGLAVREARARDADMVMLRMKGAGPDRSSAGDSRLRTVEVVGGVVAPPVTPIRLGPPERPCALVGCGSETTAVLAQRAGTGTHLLPSGAFAIVEGLAEAACIATALFDTDNTAPVVLDYGLAGSDGSMDTSRLDALLRLPSPGYPLATRSAALALDALNTSFKTVIAGESASLGTSFEFFSLWRVTPLGR